MGEKKNLQGKISGFNEYHTDAYAIAVRNGFEGTEAEWLESLRGSDALHSVQTEVIGGVLVMIQKES